MTETTYNGWTNYATWRVNLEVFDGFDPFDNFSDDQAGMEDNLAEYLKDYAEELINMSVQDPHAPSLAVDYAMAFLADVNWREIAGHLIVDYAVETNQPINNKIFSEVNS